MNPQGSTASHSVVRLGHAGHSFVMLRGLSDMGHGFFVPIVAGFIVWQNRRELLALTPSPNWWGLVVVLYGALQLYIATLGAELFLARTAFVISIIGMVLLLGGTAYVRLLAFPLFLLFFMIPIPTVVYNSITFPLQILASRVSTDALNLMQIPVLREGNVLELAQQKLSVVEACSGIRSLLSLTFLSLVYGYFFESKVWMRVLLFLSTIPIAIVANASRVTLTGVLTEFKPELAEGFKPHRIRLGDFHGSSGNPDCAAPNSERGVPAAACPPITIPVGCAISIWACSRWC